MWGAAVRVLALILAGAVSVAGVATAHADDSLARVRERGTLRWGGDLQGGEPYAFVDPTDTAQLMPNCSRTTSSRTWPSPAAMTRSSVVRASRMEPCPASATSRKLWGSKETPSNSHTC